MERTAEDRDRIHGLVTRAEDALARLAQRVGGEGGAVGIDAAGTVTWNGSPVDEVTLRQYLDQTAAMNPEPELHFQPAPDAKYAKVDETLAIIKRSAVSKLGFIGNEQYRNDF